MDMRIEVVTLPATDVDESKKFYESLGFNVDVDLPVSDDVRVVQLTPPGSSCSVLVGKGLPLTADQPVSGMYLCVDDIEQAIASFNDAGVTVDGPYHYTQEAGQVEGVDPNRAQYNSFGFFSDPAGNRWMLQESPRG